MSLPVADVDLPIITEPRSAEWVARLVGAIVGDVSEPCCDLDQVERIVQAIRNEASRDLCIAVEKHFLSDEDSNNPDIQRVFSMLAREGFIEP